MERFCWAARTAARLRHPNIVAVFDSGSDAEQHDLVMEEVAGQSLAELLAGQGRLAPRRAAELAAAHIAKAVREGQEDDKREDARKKLAELEGKVEELIGKGKIRPPATTQIHQATAKLAQAVRDLLGGLLHEYTELYERPLRTLHLQAGRVPARRPGRHQEPQPAAYKQRQSLQREPLLP